MGDNSHFFYKYRSLENMTRFLDILLYHRLYAPTYQELNDPMEGFFKTKKGNGEKSKIIREKLKSYRIVSLSKNYDIGYMWSHYANVHKGCCIELEITSKDWEYTEIDYCKKPLEPEIDDNESLDNIPKLILSKKTTQWICEEEVRFLKDFSSKKRINPYININIIRVLYGFKCDDKTIKALNKIITLINNNIQTTKLQKKELNFGFDEDYIRFRKI